MHAQTIKEQLINLAKAIGFDLIGFTTPEVDTAIQKKFDEWLQQGYYAGMEWMKKTAAIRKDPDLLLPGVKTIIPVALSYVREKQEQIQSKKKITGKIAAYALSKDYHYIFRKKMKRFAHEALQVFQHYGYKEKIIFANDTKPLFERYFAWKAGLGFIGRNTLLITKEYGSYVLLGCFLTTLALPPDKPGEGTCGTCKRCIQQCPTQALKPYQLNANRCIAYWTIEHKGPFPKEIKKRLTFAGNLFGCDICQEVCPYNKKVLAKARNELAEQRIAPMLEVEKILQFSSYEEFWEYFKGTPVMRAGLEGLKRNAQFLLQEQKKIMKNDKVSKRE